MSREDVVAKLGPATKQFELRLLSEVISFGIEENPSNLFSTLVLGTETWRYTFWVTSNDRRKVQIFFSKDGHVIGWVKDRSAAAIEKYMHERLTMQLKDDMRQLQVRALFGAPQEILHRQISSDDLVEIYADHFWTKDRSYWDAAWEIWIYRYPLGNNIERKVYIAWNKVGVDGWGYDHAHLEAERYLREHKQ